MRPRGAPFAIAMQWGVLLMSPSATLAIDRISCRENDVDRVHARLQGGDGQVLAVCLQAGVELPTPLRFIGWIDEA